MLLRAAGLTIFLFSLLTWVYVIILQVTHPEWLDLPFSHVHLFPFNWPLDEVGMAAFAIAIGGFLLWQFELNSGRTRTRK